MVLDNSTSHAVLWPGANHITIDLGTLPGGHYSDAAAINLAGDVVGTSDDANWVGHATLWTGPGHVPVALATLGGTYGAAYGINDRGDIVGYSQSATGYVFHATLWPAPGHLPVDLGTLGGTWGAAYGINAAGDIVGYSATSGDLARHATLWSSGAAAPAPTCKSSLILRSQSSLRSERSDRRRVVSSAPVSRALTTAATTARVVVDLGTLPGGSWSQAASVNAYGQIVGLGENVNLESRAMFWKPTSVLPPPVVVPPGNRDGNHENNGNEDGDC
jgi:probable HAF family extracellular repeat protein